MATTPNQPLVTLQDLFNRLQTYEEFLDDYSLEEFVEQVNNFNQLRDDVLAYKLTSEEERDAEKRGKYNSLTSVLNNLIFRRIRKEVLTSDVSKENLEKLEIFLNAKDFFNVNAESKKNQWLNFIKFRLDILRFDEGFTKDFQEGFKDFNEGRSEDGPQKLNEMMEAYFAKIQQMRDMIEGDFSSNKSIQKYVKNLRSSFMRKLFLYENKIAIVDYREKYSSGKMRFEDYATNIAKIRISLYKYGGGLYNDAQQEILQETLRELDNSFLHSLQLEVQGHVKNQDSKTLAKFERWLIDTTAFPDDSRIVYLGVVLFGKVKIDALNQALSFENKLQNLIDFLQNFSQKIHAGIDPHELSVASGIIINCVTSGIDLIDQWVRNFPDSREENFEQIDKFNETLNKFLDSLKGSGANLSDEGQAKLDGIQQAFYGVPSGVYYRHIQEGLAWLEKQSQEGRNVSPSLANIRERIKNYYSEAEKQLGNNFDVVEVRKLEGILEALVQHEHEKTPTSHEVIVKSQASPDDIAKPQIPHEDILPPVVKPQVTHDVVVPPLTQSQVTDAHVDESLNFLDDRLKGYQKYLDNWFAKGKGKYFSGKLMLSSSKRTERERQLELLRVAHTKIFEISQKAENPKKLIQLLWVVAEAIKAKIGDRSDELYQKMERVSEQCKDTLYGKAPSLMPPTLKQDPYELNQAFKIRFMGALDPQKKEFKVWNQKVNDGWVEGLKAFIKALHEPKGLRVIEQALPEAFKKLFTNAHLDYDAQHPGQKPEKTLATSPKPEGSAEPSPSLPPKEPPPHL